jgi:opacity protein-like surface antigen
MLKLIKYQIVISIFLFSFKLFTQDTTYSSIAPQKILDMLKPGKPPVATIQLSFNYNTGLMDLAANDNTSFHAADFVSGRNFGTRYGYGLNLTGKFSLHKEGNIRLNISGGFNRFQSDFVVSASPEGKVSYNVFSGSIGIEDNFTPNRKFKPYVGLDIVTSFINGKATLATDSTDFNLTINSAMRIGLALNFGFEYAINNNIGFNIGMKITDANVMNRQSKVSSNPNETYLNDDKVTGTPIPYAGWKQFVYSTIFAGIDYYFGMKNKK